MMRTLSAVVALLAFITAFDAYAVDTKREIVAQACGNGPCQPRPPEEPGSGGGSTCQWCYLTTYAAYGNCYTGDAAPGVTTKYSNCRGTRRCWTDGSGNTYCEPACEGSLCLDI